MSQTEARQLIMSEDGEVLGVKVLLIPPNTEAWKLRQKYQKRANDLMVFLPLNFRARA